MGVSPVIDSREIAIIGYGAITAAGPDAESGYDTIGRRKVNTTVYGSDFFPAPFRAPCFRVTDTWLQPGRLAGISEQTGQTNRTIQLALTAIGEACARADVDMERLRSLRVGIVFGTTVGCTFHNEQYYLDWKAGKSPDPGPLTTYLSANLAARLQQLLGVCGPRAVITNACASSTDAIGVGRNWLLHDLCDLVITGGADELSRIACHGFKSLMLVSAENCRPFDRNRQGLNLGEGAGVLILEKATGVRARGGRIYGRLCGYGIGGDAHHPTAPHPSGRGLQHAVRMALDDAGLGVDSIAMINAHGTGTPTNDKAETGAVHTLGFPAGQAPLVSTKGATGHTLGAAGAVEAVFTLVALNRGTLFGTVGCREVDETFAYPVLAEKNVVTLRGTIGLTQSLAFGGSNGALVIEGMP